MIDVNQLCPKPQSKPIGCVKIDGHSARYSDRRYGDVLETEGEPIGTITKVGRKFWTRFEEFGKLSYCINASYSLQFQFIGSLADIKARIGNSVPPLFMYAIASQIRAVMYNQPMQNFKERDYLKILDEAWQQHLAPRSENAPTVISTFAGAGGSSLGYSMAGYRELLAVEWDDNAVATFKLNFPDVPVYHGDIAKLSVDEYLKLSGLKVGELDVLDGSPPCQGFSTAGKRLMDDPRNQLFREYVRLLRGLQPKIFVMENVSGMVKGKMKLIFADILRELKVSGYQVKAWLMNAMYFNVPQSRQRMIFIGVRNDLALVPTELKPESKPMVVRQAFEGLSLTEKCESQGHVWPSIRHESKTYQALLKTPSGKKLYGFTIAKRLSFERVAGTLQTGGEVPGCPSSSWFAHPTENRGISIREAARLSSFPDTYLLQGDYRQLAKQLGNSVPPLFMRSIALHVRKTILDPQ